MRWFILLAVLYVVVYGAFRTVNYAQETDEVIYPTDLSPLYYVFRPMAYIDQALTGTGSHIGPHQEVQ